MRISAHRALREPTLVMEMHQVRYFLAVASHLNFTRAARDLRIAQPSLTRAIRKLEDELAGPLFSRERSNTHLTELGRLMLPHLRASHAAAEAAAEQARRLRQCKTGSLALGVSGAVPADLPSATVAAATRRMTEIDVRIDVATGAEIERRLLAGEFDAAILASTEVSTERVSVKEIASDPLVVAFAPGHRFSAYAAVPLASLDGEPQVAHTGWDHAEAAMAGAGLRRRIRGRSGDGAWVAGMIRAGLGCAVVPVGFATAQALDHRPLEPMTLRHRIVLATVSGRRHSAALTALVRAVERDGGAKPARMPDAPRALGIRRSG